MWKPLSIVSGVALLAAGGISYTMVRPALIAERKQAENSDKWLADAKKRETDAQGAEKQRDEQLKGLQASLTKAQSAKAAAVAQKEEATKQLETQAAEKDAAAKDLAETQEKIKGYGDIPTLIAERQSLEAKRAEYNGQIESAKNSIAASLARKSSTDKTIASIKRIELWQSSGRMPDGFSSRITSVNPEWGFVTIAAGNGSSVVKQAKLDVTRGGSIIGTVVVTQVNPGSSVAEVVPGTIAPGDAFLPGDRVRVNVASRGSSANVAPTPSAPAPAAPGAPAAPAAAAPADPFATPSADGAAPVSPPAETPAPAAEAPAPAPAVETPAAPAETPAAPAEPAPAPPAETPAPAPGN